MCRDPTAPPELKCCNLWAPCHVTKAEIYAGDAASTELYPSKEGPDRPAPAFNSVLGAYLLRGDM